jgi:hypothetical protein
MIEVAEGWVNPFLRDGTPTPGRIVNFHHKTDEVDWPAMVMEIRGVDGLGRRIPSTMDDRALKEIEDHHGEIRIEAHLVVFRPRLIEWTWSVMSEIAGGWSWPVRAEGKSK